MIVIVLAGLWHGANWTFAIWGALHGAMLVLNHGWRNLRMSKAAIFNGSTAKLAFIALTFFAVTLAWIPFRSQSFHDAARMLVALTPSGEKIGAVATLASVWLAVVAAATFLLPNSNQIFARFDPVLNLSKQQLQSWGSLGKLDWKVASILATMFIFSVLHLSHVNQFLYFRF